MQNMIYFGLSSQVLIFKNINAHNTHVLAIMKKCDAELYTQTCIF